MIVKTWKDSNTSWTVTFRQAEELAKVSKNIGLRELIQLLEIP